jgi:hypothetical protein
MPPKIVRMGGPRALIGSQRFSKAEQSGGIP